LRARITILVGIAVVTTLVIVGIVNLVKPGGGSSGIAKGQAVPAVVGTTLDGQGFDLASLRGRPVVLNFWGPSCVPCVTEFPLLQAKLGAHAAEGLAIVGVLTDDPTEPARDFVARLGATWPTVIDPGAALKASYRVLGRPQTFFIDRAGILREIQIGELTDRDFERDFAVIVGS
jgi:cytochrome c biogenesis protein CcmG/thiol:disulfide interchange protein DsbE